MPDTDPSPADQHTDEPEPAPADGHQTDTRMMWVMMIGCCLAIPFALLVGAAGLAGASPWLIGIGIVLAVTLLLVRRASASRGCGPPSGSPAPPR